MSKTNRGKQFEQQIRKGFELVENTSVDRLPDQMTGFKGSTNICDFIIYNKPYEYYIECKSHYGNTLPLNCITDNQWKGLLLKSKIKGVIAGVIVWFIDHDLTYFIPIQSLDYLKKKGSKSVNVKMTDFLESNCIPIFGKKKRILFEYDMKSFISKTQEKYR